MSVASDGSVQLERQQPLAEQAYRALRERIATGELDPGRRLTERGLADWLGVSATPIREALRRLEQEGLIARTGGRSLSVVAHSDEALRELLHAEVVLRAAAARFAAEKITEEQIEELARLVELVAEEVDSASAEQLLAWSARFDAVLVQAADSPIVQHLIDSTEVMGRRRRLRAMTLMRGSAREIGGRQLRAHRAIVAALRDRDPDRVEHLTRERLLALLSILLEAQAGAA